MSLLRTFIAVEIPAPIRQTIQRKTEALCNTLSDSLVRWVAMDNLHLTLKFLGAVSSAKMAELTQMLRVETDSFSAFDIQLSGLGSFPSLRRPRVLFIGIQAPAALEALQHSIESACARLGYESEARDFHPHLSIGRVRRDISTSDQQKIRHAIEATKIDSLGTARVDSVHLYKSDLKPSGSVYTKLFSAPLKQ
jgi:RNA 2',3'-cyclic 3'-phosphodiesterase